MMQKGTKGLSLAFVAALLLMVLITTFLAVFDPLNETFQDDMQDSSLASRPAEHESVSGGTPSVVDGGAPTTAATTTDIVTTVGLNSSGLITTSLPLSNDAIFASFFAPRPGHEYPNNTLLRTDKEQCAAMVPVPPGFGLPAGATWCRVDVEFGTPAVLWHGFWDQREGRAVTLPAARRGDTPDAPPCFPALPAPWYAGILSVRNGTVMGPDGTVVSPTSVYTLGWSYRAVPGAPLPPGPRLTAPLMNLCMMWSYSFQHFVFDTLPRVAMALPFLLAHPEILILTNGGPAESMLGALGIDKSRLIEAGDFMYSAPTVYIPHFGAHDMGLMPPGVLTTVREKLAGPVVRDRHTVLFLTRTHGKRAMDPGNEQELIGAVKAALRAPYDLVVVRSASNWLDDRAVFARAAAVFGVHGGAFSNILFCAPETPIIEFLPYCRFSQTNTHARACYYGLSLGLGLPYRYIEPTYFDYDQGGVRVNAQEVVAALRHVLPAAFEG